jgi:phosphoserine phosphatase RsbU/P
MRILVAEDDLTSRRILQAMLKQWDYEVVGVDNGDSAWEAMQADDAPRLALLDWMMPGLQGPDICKLVRESKSRVQPYLILLTAKDSQKDIIDGLNSGADDFISKPYSAGELRARVDVGRRLVEMQDLLAKRVSELQDALSHVNTLQGILPICMTCHKIRNDHESWERLDEYLGDHTDAEISHGLCPECMSAQHDEMTDSFKEEDFLE